MELINGNSEIIKDFFQSMERMLESIGKLAKKSRPHLNGEKFLSNREASKYLKVSIRTLQEWRDTGVIPYIQIKGKIIYRQSDIERLLRHYKIFCVNGNTGFRNESRIFNFIHLQNEEEYERKESSSA